MKNIVTTTLVFILAISFIKSQDLSLGQNDLLDDEQQVQQMEQQVLDYCSLVLSTPINKKNEERAKASGFILRWMENTPDYSFSISESVYGLTKGNTEQINVYLACLVKATLKNINPYENNKEVMLNCLNDFLDYCSIPENNAKPSKEVKKLLKSRESGTLSDFLAMM